MSDIIITKKNESYIRVTSDDKGALYELNEHFIFDVPGAKFTPKFKAKVWDGKIKLYSLSKQEIYAGLFDSVVDFCRIRDYDVVLKPSPVYGIPGQQANIIPEDVVAYIKSLNLHSRGEPIEFRDYQYKAVYEALKHKRLTLQSPTGSGKSAIAYCIIRYILDHHDMRSLVIVPTTALVVQMFKDFADYSTHNGFDVDENVAIIMSGYEKDVTKNICISTWQSIYKLPPAWFNKYDMIICDEVHLAKADSIRGVMEKATDVSYRIGMTGSLDGSKTNGLVIQGLFGKIEKVSSTRELIDEGHLSEIEIKCLVLQYNNETRHLLKNADYRLEIEFIVSHERRNKFIRNLALSLDGNTLLLYTLVEKHGEILFNMIKDKAGERAVHFVHGGVDTDDRDAVRGIMEKSKNCITVASVGTMSTGSNIRNIHNIILASPTKSVIRVLQSIGRGLRKTDDEVALTVYDISDQINKSKTKMNFTYSHFVERLKIYTKEEFQYSIIEVPIE